MDRKTLKRILIHFYKDNKWTLAEDKLIWQDISPEPTQTELESRSLLLKIEDTKDALISEITEFFKTTARIMLIKNGKEQPIIADLEFRQDLNSAIDQAKTKGIYTHCVTDRSGQFLLLNGQTIDINISETGLDKISQIINTRAGYCYKAIGYHTAIIKAIQSLEVLENYKANNCYLLEGEEVWKVCNGKDYEIPNIIKVNDNGEVVSW